MYSPLLNEIFGQIGQSFGSVAGQVGSGLSSIGNVGLMFLSPGGSPASSAFGGGYSSGVSSNLNLGGIGSLIGMSQGGPQGAVIGSVAGQTAGGMLTNLPQVFPGAPSINPNSPNSPSYLGSGQSGSALFGQISTAMPTILLVIIGIGALAFAFFGRSD